jgi:molybdenum cofactor guanylyltransferase
MPAAFVPPLGVVLAGGAGRRLGGCKPTADLLGRPLVAWPLQAMTAVLEEVVVVAKAGTALPADLAAPVWVEPDAPQHPITGLLHALGHADGRAILVCAVDLPCVTAATIRRLAAAADDPSRPVLAVDGAGRVQPLLARYPAATARAFAVAGRDARLSTVVGPLDPVLVTVPDDELLNVNDPADLQRAAARLSRT